MIAPARREVLAWLLLIAAGLAGIGLILAMDRSAAADSSPQRPAPFSVMRATERPPECTPVVIRLNSGTGRRLWVRFCGTGSGGETPVLPAVRRLVVDGGNLTDCPQQSPCVLLWPGSPPS